MSPSQGVVSARRSGRSRTIGVVVAIVVVVLVLSARSIASMVTDLWWFRSLGQSDVWVTRQVVQIVLAVAFSLVFFVLLWANMTIAERLAPAVRPRGQRDELVVRYRELVDSRQRFVYVAVSALFAVIAGMGASGEWRSWLLFRHGGEVGQVDPLHHVDLGFYLFKLPFLSYVVGWLFAAMVIVVMVVAVVHYLNGALRIPGVGGVVSGRVKVHLSLLLAGLALVRGADHWLDRYRLTFSERGTVTGALHTDVNASLPAAELLTIVSVFCAGLLVVNIRRRGWGLPMVAVGLWAVVSIVASGLYPVVVQRFVVSPEQSKLERRYLERNIAATRSSFGLADVEVHGYDYEEALSSDAVEANTATLRNIRLLDPAVVTRSFNSLQAKAGYYEFSDLDVDRYDIDGAPTQVLISTRELKRDAIPSDTWESTHLRYTHGVGVAMAPANHVDADGLPSFVAGGVPTLVDKTVEGVSLKRPQVYFGETASSGLDDDYAIVDTNLEEQDHQFAGDGGVRVDGTLGRLAFALRFGDLDPLISNYVTDESRVLYVRNVRDRVESLAPFVSWDADSYPVLVNGGISFVIDGYTTADTMPYSQRVLPEVDADSGLYGQQINYVRNSVKAVVDAYSGETHLYRVDEFYPDGPDPVIAAYQRAFPTLIEDGKLLPEALLAHLRYPEDFFRVQTQMWTRYHLTDPDEFYSREDGWSVAVQPPSSIDAQVTSAQTNEVTPYYLQMRLPDERSDEFALLRPFVPYTSANGSPRKQLTAFMVARSDPGRYGRLEVFEMSEGRSKGELVANRNVAGPLAAHEAMVSDTKSRFTEQLTLLNGRGGGSRATLGNMVMVPVGRSLLYVRPVYVAGDAEGSANPLRLVVVWVNGQVAVGDTLDDALADLFPEANLGPAEGTADPTDPADPADPADPDTPTASGADELLSQAIDLFDQADAALRAGGPDSLGDYQRLVDEAAAKVQSAYSSLAPTSAPPG